MATQIKNRPRRARQVDRCKPYGMPSMSDKSATSSAMEPIRQEQSTLFTWTGHCDERLVPEMATVLTAQEWGQKLGVVRCSLMQERGVHGRNHGEDAGTFHRLIGALAIPCEGGLPMDNTPGGTRRVLSEPGATRRTLKITSVWGFVCDITSAQAEGIPVGEEGIPPATNGRRYTLPKHARDEGRGEPSSAEALGRGRVSGSGKNL